MSDASDAWRLRQCIQIVLEEMSMRKFKRGHAEVRGVVDAPAEQVWELLTDWDALLTWWIKPEEGGRPGPDLASVELVGGPHDVPRTRVVRHVTGSTVDETLLVQNDETRRIYYNMVYRPNPGGAVLRSEFENYLATTMVDTLPDGKTLMTFKAEFDVVEPADLDLMRSIIERTWTDAILQGFRRYFARTKAS
ncbi:SRPBCC family protein [Trinickia symbiotica]|uniref:SRPBCC family protein n=2 Tax=Trinickia symbiotica TaxID=863227 RepID=A0A2N7WM01_9BURK|nr:SRPBCC family protein [Trinickia symbiotica]